MSEHWSRLDELERENAVLREQAEFGADMLEKAAEYKQRAEKAEAENAALRGLLQDSLEWLDDYGMRMSGTSNLLNRIETVLRKEVQP